MVVIKLEQSPKEYAVMKEADKDFVYIISSFFGVSVSEPSKNNNILNFSILFFLGTTALVAGVAGGILTGTSASIYVAMTASSVLWPFIKSMMAKDSGKEPAAPKPGEEKSPLEIKESEARIAEYEERTKNLKLKNEKLERASKPDIIDGYKTTLLTLRNKIQAKLTITDQSLKAVDRSPPPSSPETNKKAVNALHEKWQLFDINTIVNSLDEADRDIIKKISNRTAKFTSNNGSSHLSADRNRPIDARPYQSAVEKLLNASDDDIEGLAHKLYFRNKLPSVQK